MAAGYPIGRLSNAQFIGSNEMWPEPMLALRLHDVVSKHLGPAHGVLFALPDAATSTQDANWATSFSGLPQRFSSLSNDEQAATRLLVAQRLRDVRDLSARLDEIDPPNADLSAPLARACRYVSDECLYNIDGEPVLVYWGHGTETGKALLQDLAALLPPPPQTTDQRVPWYRRVPVWLCLVLGIIGLLLLLALLWWLFWPNDEVKAEVPTMPPATQSNPPTPVPTMPAPQATAPQILAPQTGVPRVPSSSTQSVPPTQPLPTQPVPVQTVVPPMASADLRLNFRAAQTREEYLRNQIVGLERQLVEALNICAVPTTPVLQSETPSLSPPPQVVPDPPMPDPRLNPQPEPPLTPAPQVQAEQPPQPVPPLESCPSEREPWEAPEVVMVFDVSGSMELPMDMNPAKAKQLMDRAIAGDANAIRQFSALSQQPGEKRIDRAKVAVSEVVSTLPDDIDTGLVLVGDCSGAISHKFYTPSERSKMLSLIKGLKTQQGTPLARGVERAGNMISASVPEGVIVLISDGQDSCGGDPCAVAKALAQAKPNVRINVVDIGGSGAGKCLAAATGGRVMVVNRIEDLQSSIQRAAGQELPAHCR